MGDAAVNIEQVIAQNIKANFEACRGRNGVSADKLAAALMPLVRRAQAEARAQELRDFAADLDRYVGTSLNAESAARFARVKSKGIEQEAGA